MRNSSSTDRNVQAILYIIYMSRKQPTQEGNG